MEIEFKKANADDVEEIVSLCNECFDEETSVHEAKKAMIESKKDKNQIYLIGLYKNRVIAHTKITIIPTIYGKMGTYCILNHVCVKPEYRRHNIATKMLKECEKIAKARGCITMKLWSSNFRKPAHLCYKRNGYEAYDATFFTKDI